MKTVTVFVEGAIEKPKNPIEKELTTKCRRAFSKLFGMKHVSFVPCGGRGTTFRQFKAEFENQSRTSWPILLVDSEEEVILESKIEHLKKQDGWDFPVGVEERHIQFMSTCMESWLIYEQKGLRAFYGRCLQESGLPSRFEMERRHRHLLFENLCHATRDCVKEKVYSKGIAFQILEGVDREILKELTYFKLAFTAIQGHINK
ncbi:hypothetical protein [Armatimonas sp.]|uniref:hypothetical protein n=1 Tax=Armatimonas sp. TaxID=1872638 RepID=UPI0037523EB4